MSMALGTRYSALGTRHMGNFGFTFIDARASGFKRGAKMMKMEMEMKMIESSSLSSSPSFAHLKW